jgi:zinc and cadmium transporter
VEDEFVDEILLILGSVLLVSLVSLVGVMFLGLRQQFLARLLLGLVGFASGSLIGGAFLHLVPHSLETISSATVFQLTILGILLFFVLEKFLYWRHCHQAECDVHTFAYVNLVGDGVHNFLDGMIIAAAYLTATPLGITTTLAVLFHEIPQEIGDFGVLVYGGLSRGRALLYNLFSALTAVAGAVSIVLLGSLIASTVPLIIPFAAGGFIYIAGTDLMPELHKRFTPKDSLMQTAAIVLGVSLMWILTFIE